MLRSNDDLSREWQALCLLARLPLDAVALARWAALVQAGLQPAELTRLAIRHQLAPLVAHHLHRHAPQLLTAELKQYAQRNLIRSQFLLQTLLTLGQEWQTAGLCCAPMKGPVLAQMIYGSVGLRDYCDLDVLVHPQDMAKVEQICARQGFRHKNDFSMSRAAAVRRNSYDLQLVRESDGIVLELHWALNAHYAGIAFARLHWWDGLQAMTLNGRALPALAAAETLLLLCLHGSKDGWDKLKLLADVAQLLRVTPRFDWPHLWRSASAVRAEPFVRIGLRLAYEIAEAPLPDDLRHDLLLDTRLHASLAQARDLLLNERSQDETAAARHAFFLGAQRHWWEKLRYGWLYALTPGSTEWHYIKLPAALRLGYPLLRLARLTKFYGLRWLGLSAAEKE